MKRIVKVFATGKEQDEIANKFQVIERYDGYVLIEVPEENISKLSDYLMEDISEQYKVEFENKDLTTIPLAESIDSAIITKDKTKDLLKKDESVSKHHYLVQFIGPIKEEWLTAVKKAGGELREPYCDFTYVVRTDKKKLEKISSLPFIRWVGHLPYAARIDRALRAKQANGTEEYGLPRTRILAGVFTVEFFGAKDVANAAEEVKQLGFDVLVEDTKGKVLIVQSKDGKKDTSDQIERLSTVHAVRKIRERAINRPSNNIAAEVMGTTIAMSNSNIGLGLSGKGEIIGICDTGIDTGDTKTINKDFEKRIIAIKSYPITPDFNDYINNPNSDDGPADLDSGHGTHVSGSVLGNGANSLLLEGLPVPIRGLAYNAQLVFQAVEQEMKWKNPTDLTRNGRFLLAGIPTDLKTLFAYAYQKGARIHSNSWGGGKAGEYDEQCRQLDEFVWNNRDFCVLVAAGNDGTDEDGDGKINLMSVTSPGTAKNCITIGACENKRPEFNSDVYGRWWPRDYPVAPIKDDPMADNPDQVVAFSSRGPTRDKRYKPDVVAPGTFILSTRSSMIALNNKGWAAFPSSRQYFYMGGTSMATPLSAGSVALIREFLRTKKNIASPSAALLKATLIAGATRLPGDEPAGVLVDNHQGYGRINIDAIVAAKANVEFVEVQPGLKTGGVFTKQIEVTNHSALRIVLAYSDFPGSSLINNLNLIVTGPDGKKYVGNQVGDGSAKLDAVNNVEVIQIDKPVVGTWRIDAIGSNIPQGPQDFALVLTF